MQLVGDAVPQRVFRYRQRDVPSSLTDISTVDTYVHTIRFLNRTGSPITITLQDRQGTPLEFYSAVSIAANSVSNERIAKPAFFEGGVSIQAGAATGLNAYIEGYQVG